MEAVTVSLDPRWVAAIYDLFRAGRVPPEREIEEVLEEYLRSVIEQIPGGSMTTILYEQEESEA